MSSSIAPTALNPSIPSKNAGGSAASGGGSGFSGLLDMPDGRGRQAGSSSASSSAQQRPGRPHDEADSPEGDIEEATAASPLPTQDEGAHEASSVLDGNPSATADGNGKAAADAGKKTGDQNDPKDKPLPIGISAVLFGLSLPTAASAPRIDGGGSSAGSASPASAGSDTGSPAVQGTNARSVASALLNAGQLPISVNPSERRGATAQASETPGAPLVKTPSATSNGEASAPASAAQPPASAKMAGVTVMTPAVASPPGARIVAMQSADAASDKVTIPAASGMERGADSGSADAGNTAAPVIPANSPSASGPNRGNAGSHGQDGGGNSGKPASAPLHAASPQAGAASPTAFDNTGGAGGAPLGQTASSFVSGMESARPWASYMTQAAYLANGPAMAMPVRSLSIALQPAQLGSVTANLHLSGQQLRIEVEVGTEEARQRLSSDADDIVKSLRSLGFDVSHITIKHGGSNTAAAGASQATAQAQGNTQFQASANSGGGSGGGAARGNAGSNNGDNAHIPASQPAGGDGGSRGLYI